MTDRVLVAQLTDLHLGATWAPGAEEGLERAVAALLALRPRPDAVLVTGDLVDGPADDAAYARVTERLALLPMPVFVLPGNHDDPDALRRHFGLAGEPGTPLQQAVRVGPLHVLLCDTTLRGRADGSLDASRLAWLDARLGAEPTAPTMVALHHAPAPTGVVAMDELGLPAEDRAALARVLARHDQVLRVVTGHVHRPAVATVGGRVVLACPSTHRQLLLDLDGGPDLGFADDPPAFALHLLAGGELVSHLVTLA